MWSTLFAAKEHKNNCLCSSLHVLDGLKIKDCDCANNKGCQ